jgi:hypothetical protein
MVAENLPTGTAVGLLSTADPDAANIFTYALVGGVGSTDNASFAIQGNQLVTATSFNFETQNTYSARVRSTDQGGLSTDKVFTITVTDANEAATTVGLQNVTATVPESTSTATRIKLADIAVTDDALGTNALSLLGTDAASFEIDGASLYLKIGATLNYEAKSSYQVIVRAEDVSVAEATPVSTTYSLAITDVVEPPAAPQIALPATIAVTEDTTGPLAFSGTPITDADSPLTKTITARFAIADGAITASAVTGITIGGTATVRTLTGTIAAINAYLTASPARIAYTPAANNTASRTLTVTASEAYGTTVLTSSKAAMIAIAPVNDAPTTTVPASFTVTEDVRGNLVWPSASTPFTDVDSPSLTVTLSVVDGVITAAAGTGVTLGGTPTALAFSGTATALNAYFKTLGKISYTAALNNTASRALTTTVSDGLLSSSKTSTIAITAVNDAPKILAAAALSGALVGTPLEITYETLRSATGAADVESATPGLAIQAVTVGTVQKWNGTKWVTVSTASSSPLAQRLLLPGQKIRWIPPIGVTGTRAAFQVKAWDGVAFSAATAQVSVTLASSPSV